MPELGYVLKLSENINFINNLGSDEAYVGLTSIK